MSFRNIPPPDLDRLLPNTPAVVNLIEKGIEWFSNRSGNLLGTIANGDSTACWKYAILKQDTTGDFHVRKMKNSFLGLKAARGDLLLSMAEIESANRKSAGYGLRFTPAESIVLNPDRQRQESKVYSRSRKMSARVARVPIQSGTAERGTWDVKRWIRVGTTAATNATTVSLVGDFNNWDSTASPMHKRSDGKWAATLPLLPGRYQYKLVVDGKEIPDPENPDVEDDGKGGKNSVLVIGQ